MANKSKALLLVLLACLSAWALAGAEAPAGLPEEYAAYEYVCESDQYILYCYKPYLSVALQHKETGRMIGCVPVPGEIKNPSQKDAQTYSGLMIQIQQGTASTNTKYIDPMRSSHTIAYTDLEDGFAADIRFTEYQISLRVEVRLVDDELRVRVPHESIREGLLDQRTEEEILADALREEAEGSEESGSEESGEAAAADGSVTSVNIRSVILLPTFGATRQDEHEGYMLIPDGNGALVRFRQRAERGDPDFTNTYIYGPDAGFTTPPARTKLWGDYETLTDTYSLTLPVFGMARTDDGMGYIAVVESGADRCSVDVNASGAERLDYNRICASFLLREYYRQNKTKIGMVERDRTHHDLEVRYCLLSGEDANYVGMARRYREYLLDNGEVVQADTSYATRVDFLGLEQENFLFATRGVVMTTADDIREISEDLRSAGVSTLFSLYKGWQSGGLYSVPVKGFSADGALGGNGSLAALIKEEAAKGHRIDLYTDALRLNAAKTAFTYDVAGMVTKADMTEENTKPVYGKFYYLLPELSAENIGSLAESLKAAGIRSMAVGGINERLFSWSKKDTYHTRQEALDLYAGALSGVRERGMGLSMEAPLGYQLRYVDTYLNAPLDTSEYFVFDDEVPFLSIVFRGVLPVYGNYVNFEANKTEFFLQMVETGTYPSFYITQESTSALIYTNSNDLYSTGYASFRDTIIEYDRALRALAEVTGGSGIADHEILGDLRRVTYENGAVVLVNYGAEAAEIDGITVEPMSYAWKAGDEP